MPASFSPRRTPTGSRVFCTLLAVAIGVASLTEEVPAGSTTVTWKGMGLSVAPPRPAAAPERPEALGDRFRALTARLQAAAVVTLLSITADVLLAHPPVAAQLVESSVVAGAAAVSLAPARGREPVTALAAARCPRLNIAEYPGELGEVALRASEAVTAGNAALDLIGPNASIEAVQSALGQLGERWRAVALALEKLPLGVTALVSSGSEDGRSISIAQALVRLTPSVQVALIEAGLTPGEVQEVDAWLRTAGLRPARMLAGAGPISDVAELMGGADARGAAAVDSQELFPNPVRFQGGQVLALETAGAMAIEVFDAAGRLRHRQALSGRADRQMVHWDGRDVFGVSVEPGKYLVRITTHVDQRTRPLLVLP